MKGVLIVIITGIFFVSWSIICIVAFYRLARGAGMQRLHDLLLSYNIEGDEIKINIFHKFCVRRIYISYIRQILPFAGLKGKLKIFIGAEHWEHSFFKPIVCINAKSRRMSRWFLLSPDSIGKFIYQINEIKNRS